MVRVSCFKFALESGDLFLGEGFDALLQGPADVEERVFLSAAVPEGPLLAAAADVIEHACSKLDDVECVNDESPSRQLQEHSAIVAGAPAQPAPP